jgi:carbon starvation protein CstA
VLALIAAARARLAGVVLGQPVNVPVLLVVSAVLVLVLAALVLWIVRLIVRDGGLRLRPRMVTP